MPTGTATATATVVDLPLSWFSETLKDGTAAEGCEPALVGVPDSEAAVLTGTTMLDVTNCVTTLPETTVVRVCTTGDSVLAGALVEEVSVVEGCSLDASDVVDEGVGLVSSDELVEGARLEESVLEGVALDEITMLEGCMLDDGPAELGGGAELDRGKAELDSIALLD